VAVLLTLMWVGGLVGGLAGIAADRVSRRALASFGAFGYGVSLACWGLGEDWWVLAVGSLLLGVSADAMLAACEVALVDLAGDDLVRVLAPGNLGAEIGDLIGPLLLAGSAALGWSWRVPFLVTAVAAFAYAAVLAVQPLPRPRRSDEPSSAVSDVRSVLRDRRVWLLALVSLLFDTLDEPFLGFAIAFLEVERGQSHAVAVLVGGSVLVGGVVGAGAIALGAVGPRVLQPGRLPSYWPARCSGSWWLRPSRSRRCAVSPPGWPARCSGRRCRRASSVFVPGSRAPRRQWSATWRCPPRCGPSPPRLSPIASVSRLHCGSTW
jgi:MFS family permease